MLLLPGVNGGKTPSTYAAESWSGWVGELKAARRAQRLWGCCEKSRLMKKERGQAVLKGRQISLLSYLIGQKIAKAMPVLNCLIRQKIAREIYIDVQTRPFAHSRCLFPLPALIACFRCSVCQR